MAKKKEDCPTCKGNGWNWEKGSDGRDYKMDCFTCGGSGKVDAQD